MCRTVIFVLLLMFCTVELCSFGVLEVSKPFTSGMSGYRQHTAVSAATTKVRISLWPQIRYKLEVAEDVVRKKSVQCVYCLKNPTGHH